MGHENGLSPNRIVEYVTQKGERGGGVWSELEQGITPQRQIWDMGHWKGLSPNRVEYGTVREGRAAREKTQTRGRKILGHETNEDRRSVVKWDGWRGRIR